MYTYDLLQILLTNVLVRRITTLSLAQEIIRQLPQRRSGLGPVFALLPAEDNLVTEHLELVELFDILRLGRVLAFFRVEPVFGGGQAGEELVLFGLLDEGGVSAVELAAHVVDVFLEGVLAVLFISIILVDL